MQQLNFLGEPDAVPEGTFLAWARDYARHVSTAKGEVYSDQLRQEADRLGLKPHHPNVWGLVFQEEGWQRVGWIRSDWPSNHGRSVALWKWRG